MKSPLDHLFECPTLVNLQNYVDKGGSLVGFDKVGNPLFFWAAALDDYSILHFFVSSGINLQAKNAWGETALHFASAVNVDVLVEEGVSLNSLTNERGTYRQHTPLMYAVRLRKVKTVEALMKKRAHAYFITDHMESIWTILEGLNDSEYKVLISRYCLLSFGEACAWVGGTILMVLLVVIQALCK